MLPDLSPLAASVREQIETAHATLLSVTQRPESTAADRAAAYGDMGRMLLAAEFGLAAEACFVNAQALAPGEMRWPYLLGHVYRGSGDTARSAAAFERVLQLRPQDVPALIWLGDAALTDDRLDAAAAAFAKAQSLRPGEGAASLGLGRVALARREYARAVTHFEEALARGQKGDAVNYSLALAHRGLGDTARAESYAAQRGTGQMVVSDPLMEEVRQLLHSARTYESRGIQALEAGAAAAAAAQFRKGLELAPDDASLHHRLGTALFLSGDAPAGREQFEAALRLDPDLARAHYSLGVLLASEGQHQPAMTRLASAVRHDPDYVEARLLLGDLLRHTGRTKAALEQYGEVVRIDPRVAAAHVGAAVALADMKQYRQAVERVQRAMETQPDQPDLLQSLTRLLAAAPDAGVRDGAQAVALARRLLALQPNPGAPAGEAVAMAYAEAGDMSTAVAWQRQAIAAAERSGRDPGLPREMQGNLASFERGVPARVPWADYAVP